MSVVVRASLLSVLLLLPADLQAQQGQNSDQRVRLSAGTFAGIGSGPSASAVWGVEGMIPLTQVLAARGEFSLWNSGVGVGCGQSWPDSYACSVSGWAVLAGLRASLPLTQRITPFADLAGGRFTRDRVAADSYGSTALSGSVGMSIQMYRGLYARLSGTVLRPFDDDYEQLMGERLQYSMGVIGLEYRFLR